MKKASAEGEPIQKYTVQFLLKTDQRLRRLVLILRKEGKNEEGLFPKFSIEIMV